MDKIDNLTNARKLDEAFHRITNKVGRIEKIPRTFGTQTPLSTSEIHTIVKIGMDPGITVTELSREQGVTKGAVSQVIARLEKKKMIKRLREINNDKTIFLTLSKEGKKAFEGHQTFHAKMHAPLVDLLETASKDQLAFLNRFFSVVEAFCDKVLNNKS
jgi:DNA-binding MarR family transcriptional regulator